MRRIAKISSHAVSILITAAALLISLAPVSAVAKEKKPSVIVKVKTVAATNRLANTHGFSVKKTITRGTSAAFVVENINAGQMKQLLKNDVDVEWVTDNIEFLLDGGETVLPLDGGETVLPLDGGETVLPLDDGTDRWISAKLLDGGETVLPLDHLYKVRHAYKLLAERVTPSSRLILQSSFHKIGLYSSVLRATGTGVIIADLDTGADTCHPVLHGVLALTFVEGADANAPENCPTSATPIVPGFGHGTRVASLLRLTAPEATIWAMRVFNNTGSAQVSDIYEAIIYAADHGVQVINMSFGTATQSQALQDAVSYAQSRGVVLVAAGGNNNTEPLLYPAQTQGVAAVVAVTTSDIKTSFSSFGTKAFVSAPGYGLWVAHPGNKIAYVAGTSYSSPLVAGEAALIIDAYRRQYSGNPTTASVSATMSVGVNNINHLNPQYQNKIGLGRIWIPSALDNTGIAPATDAPPPEPTSSTTTTSTTDSTSSPSSTSTTTLPTVNDTTTTSPQ